ncbi:hypothetical protein [Paratractidigestivibacter sp.]|uniref:hypothetical protein n=1 Tax=Paratractidigestivibacter sp. TaxID=2847316 RepID=UPI002AC9E17A|nr:hypothetical protein [Paratractidigestivibacter sp.]
MAKGVIYAMESSVPNLVMIGAAGTEDFEARMSALESEPGAVSLKRRYAIEVEDREGVMELITNMFKNAHVPTSNLYVVDIEVVIKFFATFAGRQVFPFPDASNGSEGEDSADFPVDGLRTQEQVDAGQKLAGGHPAVEGDPRGEGLYQGARQARAQNSGQQPAETEAPRPVKKVKGISYIDPNRLHFCYASMREYEKGLLWHPVPRNRDGSVHYGTVDDSSCLWIDRRFRDHIKVVQDAYAYGSPEVSKRAGKRLSRIEDRIYEQFGISVHLGSGMQGEDTRQKVEGLPKDKPRPPHCVYNMAEFNRRLEKSPLPRDQEGDVHYGTVDDSGCLRIDERCSDHIAELQEAYAYGTPKVSAQASERLSRIEEEIKKKFRVSVHLESGIYRACGKDQSEIIDILEEIRSDPDAVRQIAWQLPMMIGSAAQRPKNAASPFGTRSHTYEVRTPDGKLFGCYTRWEYEFLFKGKGHFKGQDGEKYWEVDFDDVRPIVEGPGFREIQNDDGTFSGWDYAHYLMACLESGSF